MTDPLGKSKEHRLPSSPHQACLMEQEGRGHFEKSNGSGESAPLRGITSRKESGGWDGDIPEGKVPQARAKA
jgi:hypothetical protein